MTNFQPVRTTYGDGPWEGAAKWVRVKDHDEIGKVVDPGKNVGFESCYGILFESSGQVCYYRKKDVERCDPGGNTRSPSR